MAVGQTVMEALRKSGTVDLEAKAAGVYDRRYPVEGVYHRM